MLNSPIKTITNNRKWRTYSKINLGYSDEIKYHVINYKNEEYLIKIGSYNNFPRKQLVYRLLKKISNLPFKKPQNFDYGYFNEKNNVFSIQSWIDGEVLKDKINLLPQTTKYMLGKIAGSSLNMIHKIKLDEKDCVPINLIRRRRAKKMLLYMNSKMKTGYDNILINFINDNINKINDFVPCYIHHDFHLNNMIIDKDLKFGIIDFDKATVEDPILDLVKIQMYDVDISYEFCLGVLKGYFDKNIPNTFWLKYAVLTAYNCLSLSLWANSKGLSEILKVNRIVKGVLKQYDNFNNFIPHWYYRLAIKPNAEQFKFNKEFKIDITED